MMLLTISAINDVDVDFADLNPTEAVDRVLESRKQVYCGDITYRVTESSGKRVIEVRSVFDYSGGRSWLRFDVSRTGVKVQAIDDPVNILSNDGRHVERMVLKDGTCTSFIADEYSDGSRSVVSISDFEERQRQCNQQVVDPLVIGMSADSYGHLAGVSADQVFAKLPMEMPSLVRDDSGDFGSVPIWKLEFTSVHNVSVGVWISPSQGCNIVRTRIGGNFKNVGLMISETNSRLRQFNDDLWFPEFVTWQRTVDGKSVMQEDTEIKEAVFNRPIDSEIFSLAGLDIPTGISVVNDSVSADQIWDGKQVVTLQATPEPLVDLQPPNRSKALILLAVNLAVLAIIAFAVYLRLRRQDQIRSSSK